MSYINIISKQEEKYTNHKIDLKFVSINENPYQNVTCTFFPSWWFFPTLCSSPSVPGPATT